MVSPDGSSDGGTSNEGNAGSRYVATLRQTLHQKSLGNVLRKVRQKEVTRQENNKKYVQLQRDSDILFASPVDNNHENDDRRHRRRREGNDPPRPYDALGIFDRPGFGSVAFRNAVPASLFSFPSSSGHDEGEEEEEDDDDASALPPNKPYCDDLDDVFHVQTTTIHEEESIGSAGSLVISSSNSGTAGDPDQDPDETPLGPTHPFAGVGVFLTTLGLQEWIPLFERERIDLFALHLIDENDLRTMGIPTGPRKKIVKAISDRKRDLQDEVPIEDSRL